MRALIAGILFVGGVTSACTSGSSARYSADGVSTPVVARRNAPVWPTEASPRSESVVAAAPRPAPTYAPTPTPVPSYVPPRTAAPQPIVLSSRAAPAPAPAYVSSRSSGTLPPPASRARTAAELAAALRPVNATCPVMLGTPVDPSVTASYHGRVVAFSDARSRSAWLADPERYTRNLPGTAGFGSSSDGPVFASTPAPAAPRGVYAPSDSMGTSTYAPLPPAAVRRPVYAEPAPAPVYVAAPAPAPVSAPAAVVAPRPVPVPVATRPAAPAPAPAPAPAAEEDEAGGVCVDGECKGGNCALPARRK